MKGIGSLYNLENKFQDNTTNITSTTAQTSTGTWLAEVDYVLVDLLLTAPHLHSTYLSCSGGMSHTPAQWLSDASSNQWLPNPCHRNVGNATQRRAKRHKHMRTWYFRCRIKLLRKSIGIEELKQFIPRGRTLYSPGSTRLQESLPDSTRDAGNASIGNTENIYSWPSKGRNPLTLGTRSVALRNTRLLL